MVYICVPFLFLVIYWLQGVGFEFFFVFEFFLVACFFFLCVCMVWYAM